MNQTQPKPEPVFSPEGAAGRLAQAWADGFLIHDFDRDEQPRTEAEGYAVQRRLAFLLGARIGGYKLGLGSPAAMRRTGLGRPVWGFMTKAAMFSSGVSLPEVATGKVLVETEMAFVARRAITPGERISDLASAFDAHVALEFVRSRLVDWTSRGLPSFIADSVGFHAFVLGEKLPAELISSRTLSPALLTCNGRPVAQAAEDSERADPFAALAYFLNEAAVLNLQIEPGTVITTGNLVAPFFEESGGVFQGSIGDYRVWCSVEA